MKKIHLINDLDNTGSALETIIKGEECQVLKGGRTRVIQALDEIPFAFKIAVEDIPKGGEVIKYGEVIGEASRDIHTGECVHIHNVIGKRA